MYLYGRQKLKVVHELKTIFFIDVNKYFLVEKLNQSELARE